MTFYIFFKTIILKILIDYKVKTLLKVIDIIKKILFEDSNNLLKVYF